MIKVIILTGTELRHSFIRKALALSPEIHVLKTYCEESEKWFIDKIDKTRQNSDVQLAHLNRRRLSEHDFFYPFVSLAPDASNPVEIPKGEINKTGYVKEIINLNPDIVIAYGCSIIKEPLIKAVTMTGKFLNVHLGLSPYYRGTGTNFWPLVNGEPQYVGATFMHIDKGIDTGNIIHQIRARIFPKDTPHQIGNRLISDVAPVYAEIIRKIDQLKPMRQLPIEGDEKFYLIKDFTPESVEKLYFNFDNGIIEKYLREEDVLANKAPIVENPLIEKVLK